VGNVQQSLGAMMHGDAIWRIPDPDYDRHPAYGGLFGPPQWKLRVAALRRLAPYLGAYAAYDLTSRVRRVLSRSLPGADSSVYRALSRDGAVGLRLEAAHMARIRIAVAPQVAALRAKMAGEPVAPAAEAPRSGSAGQAKRGGGTLGALHRRLNPTSNYSELFIHETDAPEVFEALREAMGATGALDAADRYQRRRMDVRYIKLVINRPDLGWWRNPFADVGLPDPPAIQMHVDHLWTTKAILYLTEVGERNGPFCYCLGSHRARIGWLEGAARRANDRVDMSSCKPEQRRLFHALPKRLRRKAKFGNDLPPDHPGLARLLASEKRFGSADGDLILFDDRGMHRGGLLEEGERIMMQIRLA
jgi:hypothetical protein